jgi:hypothetical protein
MLEKCSSCNGFVPQAADSCPHCSSKRISRSSLGAVGLVLGSGAIAFTLMACYGAAPSDMREPKTPSPDTSATPNAPSVPDAGK